MAIVLARCPHCGVDLSLDDEKENKICYHCGGEIVIRDGIRAAKEDLIRIWMKLGLSASKARNQQSACEFFGKVVEVDPDNWMAIFLQGRSAAAQSTIANPKINQLVQAVEKADQVLRKQKVNEQDLINARNMFAVALTQLTDAFSLLQSQRFEGAGDLFLDIHWNLMWETRLWYENAITHYQFAIGLLDGLQDEKSTANRVELKKKIVAKCVSICDFQLYYRDFDKKYQEAFGYRVKDKQRYIDLYDQLISEIRVHEPEFAMDQDYYIDRLDPPPTNFAHGYLESRTKVLQKLEKFIDQQRFEQTAKLRQQPYGDEQSEEDRLYLVRRPIQEKVKASNVDYSVFQEV